MDRFPIKITAHKVKEITPVYVMRARTQLEVELTIDKHQFVGFIADLFKQFDLAEINALLEHDCGLKLIETGEEDVLDNKIIYMYGMSVRLMNCLNKNGIETVGDIVTKTRKGVKLFKEMGTRSLMELDELMSKLGLEY